MRTVKNLAFAAMFLALCIVLPLVTGGIPQIGKALAPMHIPVLVCGFICGWQYGAAVGFVAPLMRSVIFNVPVMYPTAIAMAFELSVYGFLSGILYKLFPKKNLYLFPALIISMLGGRIVWGISRYIIAGLSGSHFDFSLFIAGAFTQAIPGIICQIILVPLIVISLKKINKSNI